MTENRPAIFISLFRIESMSSSAEIPSATPATSDGAISMMNGHTANSSKSFPWPFEVKLVLSLLFIFGSSVGNLIGRVGFELLYTLSKLSTPKFFLGVTIMNLAVRISGTLLFEGVWMIGRRGLRRNRNLRQLFSSSHLQANGLDASHADVLCGFCLECAMQTLQLG